MFLLDTDVLSAARRSPLDVGFEKWLYSQNPDLVFISVMTVREIDKGIAKQKGINPDFATDLEHWLDQLLRHYADRILPVTTAIARRWGRLSHVLGNSNVDILIAATAIEHNLVVVTGNTKHFESTGVKVLNPFTLK